MRNGQGSRSHGPHDCGIAVQSHLPPLQNIDFSILFRRAFSCRYLTASGFIHCRGVQSNPLAAVQVQRGLIYVSPKGSSGNPDSIAAAARSSLAWQRMTKGKFSVLPEKLLVDRLQLLTLTAPEVPVLLGGMPS